MKNEVLKVISDRRSHRAYKAEQLQEEALKAILQAGLEAPSATNRQPWHYTVVQDAALLQAIHDEAGRVFAGGDPKRAARFEEGTFQMFYHAPTVLFLFGEKDNPWAPVDCGIAVENIALAAEGLGIGSVILGLPKPAFEGPRAAELKQKLQCPDGYEFVIAISLGFSTDEKDAHEKHPEKISRLGSSSFQMPLRAL